MIGLITAGMICILVLVVLWSTFQDGLPSFKNLFSLSLNNYSQVFSSPLLLDATVNTILLGLGTTAVSIFFAVPIAWLVHRTNIRFKHFFITLMFLHVVLPGFVRVMGWIMLIGPDIGIVNQVIRSVIPLETGPLSPYNIPFMIFLQGLTLTPTLFLMLSGAFMAIDPSFEESAEASGMNRLKVFRRISFPLVRPALVAGAIYVFVTAVSMFEVPALLGTPFGTYVYATLMFDAIQPTAGLPTYGIAGVYGLMLLLPTLIALYYYQKMIKLSHRYATITGKGYRPKLIDLGPWSWIGIAFILFYYTVDIFLPYLAVVWTSLLPYLQMPSQAALASLSLGGYRNAITVIGSQGALGNTLQLVISVGLLSTLAGLVFSWIVLRTRMRGRYALDTISMLPQVVPGVAFAFAVAFLGILLARHVPFLHGSIIAIVFADFLRRVPFTTRTISSSLIQIHPELEEAVQASGASRLTALRKVIIPLITPALMYSFIWALLQAYREVTIALFLISPRNMVLSTVIWTQWISGNTGTAASISIMMIGIMAVFIFGLLRLFPQITKGLKQ